MGRSLVLVGKSVILIGKSHRVKDDGVQIDDAHQTVVIPPTGSIRDDAGSTQNSSFSIQNSSFLAQTPVEKEQKNSENS